jgi:hypothetical protein
MVLMVTRWLCKNIRDDLRVWTKQMALPPQPEFRLNQRTSLIIMRWRTTLSWLYYLHRMAFT